MAKRVVESRVGSHPTRSSGSHRVCEVDGECSTAALGCIGWHRQASPLLLCEAALRCVARGAWGWFLSLAICLFCPNLFALNGDMGGATQDGSPDSPWLIQDLADFHEFTGNSTYWNDHTRLECDPNLAGITYSTAVIAPDTSSSDGFQGTLFTGVFDGNDHTISNLTINTTIIRDNEYLGLFGKIESPGAEIINLGMENVNITGGIEDSWRLGGLCGVNRYGTISNCYITGSITGGSQLAGLCGLNDHGNINNCYATVSVTGKTISQSSSGALPQSLGGLCGLSYNGSISNCYATGSVTGRDNYNLLGGLCGLNYGSISNCYATGSVTGRDYSWQLGGLCGDNMGDISNCYSTGSVTGGDPSGDLGGLCGHNGPGIISNGYYLDTAGPHNGLGTPLDDPNMRIQSNFVSWDFVGDINGTEDYWRMCVDGIEYPKLYWQFPTGDFTCPDGVEMLDLWYFCSHWLAEGDDLRCDIAPTLGGDGIVNLLDYAVFTKYWLME